MYSQFSSKKLSPSPLNLIPYFLLTGEKILLFDPMTSSQDPPKTQEARALCWIIYAMLIGKETNKKSDNADNPITQHV